MITVKEVKTVLEDICPISLSQAFISAGRYDNSGLLIDLGSETERIVTMLDLTEDGVDYAVKSGAKIVITHHPAIYHPVSSLGIDEVQTSAVVKAIKCGISVFSMHLNLDVAPGGIDDSLAVAVTGNEGVVTKNIENVLDCGYGKEYKVNKKLSEIISELKKNLSTDRILVYGKDKKIVKAVSFCGGGASSAMEYVLGGGEADLIISSDMPHHILKDLTELNKCVIILTHYDSEVFGFKRFTEKLKKVFGKDAVTFYENKKLKG